MKIISKQEIENKLGKFTFFSGKGGNAIISHVKYMGGILAFDDLIKKGKIDNGVTTNTSFEIRPKGMLLYVLHGFSSSNIALLNEGINYWSFEKQESIKGKKSKSVVGRALLGGLLFGPVGAMVGGMTGIGDKEVSTSIEGIDNILTISYTDENDTEHILLFECKNKKESIVLTFFQKNFSKIYKESADEIESPTGSNESSIADELFKLKKLLDEGLLSKEEFDKLKSELIK